MENDNMITPTNNPLPTPTVSGPSLSPPKQGGISQEVLEYTMFVFGIIAVFSLIIRNGFMLNIGITIFLIVAIISITRNLSKSRSASNSTQFPVTSSQNPKKTNPWKIVGLALLTLLMIPIIIQGAFVLLIIVVMIMGGGKGS